MIIFHCKGIARFKNKANQKCCLTWVHRSPRVNKFVFIFKRHKKQTVLKNHKRQEDQTVPLRINKIKKKNADKKHNKSQSTNSPSSSCLSGLAVQSRKLPLTLRWPASLILDRRLCKAGESAPFCTRLDNVSASRLRFRLVEAVVGVAACWLSRRAEADGDMTCSRY